MTRHLWELMHRYVGMFMAFFLIDLWLNRMMVEQEATA